MITRFIFLFFFPLTFFGQGTNLNVYKIEKEGDIHLANGNFERAIETYNLYRGFTNGVSNLQIDKKISNVKVYASHYADGRRLISSGRIAEGIEKLKTYRALFPGIGIKSVDAKIESSIRSLEGNKARSKLAEGERIILSFEKNYLAERAIESADFTAAIGFLESSLKTVGNLSPLAKSQASTRLSQAKHCQLIQNKLRDSALSVDERLKLLESYRNIGGFLVPSFEENIALINFEKNTKLNQNPEENLKRILSNCDISAALAYVKDPEFVLTQGRQKDILFNQLSDIFTALTEIRKLLGSTDIEQRKPFVYGGYESLISDAKSIMIVSGELEQCLKREYFNILYENAKAKLDREVDLAVARELVIQAKTYAVTSAEIQTSDELLRQISNRIGCAGIIADQEVALKRIEQSLANCQLGIAETELFKVKRAIQGCSTPQLERRIKNAEQKLEIMNANSARIKKIKGDISLELASGNCSSVGNWLDQLKQIPVCNVLDNNKYIEDVNGKLIDCHHASTIKRLVSGIDKDILNINSIIRAKSKSSSHLYKELNIIRKNIDQLRSVAKFEEDRRQAKRVENETGVLQDAISKLARSEKRYRNTQYNSLFKPMLSASGLSSFPRFYQSSTQIEIADPTYDNFEVGFEFRRLKRAIGFGSILGIKYLGMNNVFMDENFLSPYRLSTEYITCEALMANNGLRLGHFLLGFGGGVRFPIRESFSHNGVEIHRTDYYEKTSYSNIHPYMKLLLGYEYHRKNIGFSINTFVTMNGLIADDKADKRTLFPAFDLNRFDTPAKGIQSNTNLFLWSAGVSLGFHLW